MKVGRKNISKIFYDALRTGLTPHKLAMTCSLGAVVGIFPVFGTTTMLCFGLAIVFRLNVAVIQLVNYLVAPLQILFIIPFIKIGTILFHLNPFPYNTDQLVELFGSDFFLLVKEVGFALLLGAGVWASFSLPLFFVLYYLFFLLFSRWLKFPQRELKSQ
jgi:uncharacterized protein (DUF2062 family)